MKNLIVLFLVSCAELQGTTDLAYKVRPYIKSDPPAHCHYIGGVQVSPLAPQWGTIDYLRDRAARAGGDTVVVTSGDARQGIAYKCNVEN